MSSRHYRRNAVMGRYDVWEGQKDRIATGLTLDLARELAAFPSLLAAAEAVLGYAPMYRVALDANRTDIYDPYVALDQLATAVRASKGQA